MLDLAMTEPASSALLRAALSEALGAALVLDAQLRIVAATPAAEALFDEQLEPGAKATDLLCDAGPKRPVADALAAGRSVTALIEPQRRKGPGGALHVRAMPLKDRGARGFLLLLDEEIGKDAGADGAVTFHGIVTRNAAMKQLLRDVAKVARSEASVLVRGETGSGKELVARAVHAESERADGPFRALNCAALPAPLLESELFGHVRGAFTGAVRDSPGHVRMAEGGTLLLDEVAELPLELQAKLLRVLQEGTVTPVGGLQPIPVNVRFIAATHRSLRGEVAAGRFRADLMYRLRVVPVFLPPLRARTDDVELLARHFIEAKNRSSARRVEHLAPGAKRRLETYTWPGNVRELINAIEYAYVMGEGPVLSEAELPPEIRGEEPSSWVAPAPPPRPRPAKPSEEERIRAALIDSGGHKAQAAELLGISRVTLWRRMKELSLE